MTARIYRKKGGSIAALFGYRKKNGQTEEIMVT